MFKAITPCTWGVTDDTRGKYYEQSIDGKKMCEN